MSEVFKRFHASLTPKAVITFPVTPDSPDYSPDYSPTTPEYTHNSPTSPDLTPYSTNSSINSTPPRLPPSPLTPVVVCPACRGLKRLREPCCSSSSVVAPPFRGLMFSRHSPATIVAADRHFAAHHLPKMSIYTAADFARGPLQECPHGSFGEVHFGRMQGDFTGPVAVKQPFPDADSLQCFYNEVRMANALPHSINLARTLGCIYDRSGGLPLSLVMTRSVETFHCFLASGGTTYTKSIAPGQSGSASLRSFGYVQLLLHLLAGIANGIAHLHACGIVHHDLSTGNVLVDRPSRGKTVIALPEAVICDMGRATREDMCGEILYRSPYMARRSPHERSLSPASDSFSLGTLVLAGLSGVGSGCADIHTIPSLDAVQPSRYILECRNIDLAAVAAGLRHIVRLCTDKEPGRRPTAVAVRDMLRGLSHSAC